VCEEVYNISEMEKMISISGNISSFPAFHTAQDNGNKLPGLIVIHEVWGLTDHIKDVAGRFAKEGFDVLAPDLLSQTGITEKMDQNIMKDIHDLAKRDEAQKKMRSAMAPIQSLEFGVETVQKLKECISFLQRDENCNGEIAVVGYCFGGTYAYALSSADSRIKTAVPFYGHAPEEEEKLASIKCPILAFYGEKDERLMEELPKLKEKMKKLKKEFEAVVYPNTGHAFFNDTNPTTYNREAADDAWRKTLAFINKCLGK
jgi:carboxymethylenebutenolidase